MFRSSLTIVSWLNALLPPVLWASFIFLLSSQATLPSAEAWQLDFIFKKSAHIIVYAVLYLLLWRSTWILLKPHGTLSWSLPLILALFYALTDELHQSFVPGRSPTLRDLGFDSLGILLSFLWLYRYV